MDELCAVNGVADMGTVPHLTGSPESVADAIRPFRDLGFGTVIVRMPAPYDDETIDRIGEVVEALER
jgi:alkanesulfonate monooxygenase SsuD/methylene tetrahydromethanopterin reductase-like flavin-dependent oxidoreductase (luciferase family)